MDIRIKLTNGCDMATVRVIRGAYLFFRRFHLDQASDLDGLYEQAFDAMIVSMAKAGVRSPVWSRQLALPMKTTREEV